MLIFRLSEDYMRQLIMLIFRLFQPGGFMKKGELIAEFAKRTEMSGAAANDAVNTIITIITERLKKGDTVGITGFGTFSVTKRAARKGRNPATGEVIKIAASKTPRFAAGATLKAAVNPKKK
jgi:DNA-binding protein HU-beta